MPAIVQLKTKIKEQEEEIKMLKKQLEENKKNFMCKAISMIHSSGTHFRDGDTNNSLLKEIKNGAKKFKKRQRRKKIFHTTILNSLVEAKQHLKPVPEIIKNEAVLALNNPYVQDIIREKEKLKLYIKNDYYLDLEFYSYIDTTIKELNGENYSGRIDRVRSYCCRLWEICRKKLELTKQYHNTDESVFSINEEITFCKRQKIKHHKYRKGVVTKIKKLRVINFGTICVYNYYITLRVGYDENLNPIYVRYLQQELLKNIIIK